MPRSLRPTPNPAERIAARGARPTPTRERVLALLSGASRPLSHDEIAALLEADGEATDRVTLYRTLDWLLAEGLAHRIAGADRAWRYNASAEDTPAHAHFHCQGCGKVFCLEQVHPTIAAVLPKGYSLDHAELSFHGRCPQCR